MRIFCRSIGGIPCGPINGKRLFETRFSGRGGWNAQDRFECALDSFKNALYARLLLQGLYLPRNYSNDAYKSTVVGIFVRGMEAPDNGNFKTVI